MVSLQKASVTTHCVSVRLPFGCSVSLYVPHYCNHAVLPLTHIATKDASAPSWLPLQALSSSMHKASPLCIEDRISALRCGIPQCGVCTEHAVTLLLSTACGAERWSYLNLRHLRCSLVDALRSLNRFRFSFWGCHRVYFALCKLSTRPFIAPVTPQTCGGSVRRDLITSRAHLNHPLAARKIN